MSTSQLLYEETFAAEPGELKIAFASSAALLLAVLLIGDAC